jgi:hypothetical protein
MEKVLVHFVQVIDLVSVQYIFFCKLTTLTYYDGPACTYKHSRSRKTSTTAYILALEARVEELKTALATANKPELLEKRFQSDDQSQGELHLNTEKSSPGILLETMVGAV